MLPSHVYILLGSNLGDKLTSIHQTTEWIERTIGNIKKKSCIYNTAAWGKTNQPSFLNQVICVESTLDAKTILQQSILIEKIMGRERIEKWGERIIDIDILFIDNQIIQSDYLQVPHPAIIDRRFTLIPLVEIAPLFIHPVYQKTLTTLLAACKDKLEVEKFQ